MRQEVNHKIYVILSALLVFSLPFFPAEISIIMILIIINWLTMPDLKHQLRNVFKNRAAILISSLYLLFVIGLLYTDYFADSLLYLQTRIPLLLLPIIIATSKPLSRKDFGIVSVFLYISVIINSITSYLLFSNIIHIKITNYRQYSFFSSNVHLSYLAIVALIILWYNRHKYIHTYSKQKNVTTIILMMWIGFYIYFLQSFSGILIMISLILIWLIYKALKINSNLKYITLLIILLFLAIGIVSSINFYNNNFKNISVDYSKLPKTTINGNKYANYKHLQSIENKNIVWLSVCQKELKKEWNKKSNIKWNKLDKKGQPITSTLVRYLASKGYSKDSVGISQLAQKDIQNIELGMCNIIFENKLNIYNRFYVIIQHLYYYLTSGFPTDSATRRIEAYVAGWHIFQQHPIFGLGTRDSKKEFTEYYHNKFPKRNINNLVGGHNQFLSIMVGYGIFGLIWLLLATIGAWYIDKGYKNTRATLVLTVLLLSMLTEVPFQQQRPLFMFVYFLCIFLFGLNDKRKA